MKRKFLLLCAFFLNSCVSPHFYSDTGCPIDEQGQRLTVLFEYGSAELNEKAVRRLQEAAEQAQNNRDFVCLLGRLSYQGSSSDQSLGALDRAKNVAAIFLQEGIDPQKIYIGIAPQKEKNPFLQPLSATEEQHVLEIWLGQRN